MRRATALFVGLTTVTACGDDPAYYPAGGDVAASDDIAAGDAAADAASDAVGDPGGGDSAGDGAIPVDLGTDRSDDARTDAESHGGVIVYEVRAPSVSDLETGGVGAGFAVEVAVPPTPIAVAGDCNVFASGAGADLFQTGPSLDAGEISVSIAATTHTLALESGAGGDRYSVRGGSAGTEMFAPGDTIRATSSGGLDVAAFDVTVAAAAEPVVTEPTWGLMDSHDRDTPLTVRWEGSGGDSVLINVLPVTVFPEPGVADGNSITCAVADTGSFTIPAEALRQLPEGSGLGGGTVALTVVRTTATTVDRAPSSVSLSAIASHTIVGSIP